MDPKENLRYDSIVRRPGLLDICAIAIFVVVLLLPGQDRSVNPAFAKAEAKNSAALIARIAKDQVILHRDPGNGEAADDMAEALSKLGRSDMALRVAGKAAAVASPTRWRSLWAISGAHADRTGHPKIWKEELDLALEYARKALDSCQNEKGQVCPDHEATRIYMWVKSLEAGVEAAKRGVNPARSPEDFRREMFSPHPRRVRTR
jgi:hypothetical protein